MTFLGQIAVPVLVELIKTLIKISGDVYRKWLKSRGYHKTGARRRKHHALSLAVLLIVPIASNTSLAGSKGELVEDFFRFVKSGRFIGSTGDEIVDLAKTLPKSKVRWLERGFKQIIGMVKMKGIRNPICGVDHEDYYSQINVLMLEFNLSKETAKDGRKLEHWPEYLRFVDAVDHTDVLDRAEELLHHAKNRVLTSIEQQALDTVKEFREIEADFVRTAVERAHNWLRDPKGSSIRGLDLVGLPGRASDECEQFNRLFEDVKRSIEEELTLNQQADLVILASSKAYRGDNPMTIEELAERLGIARKAIALIAERVGTEASKRGGTRTLDKLRELVAEQEKLYPIILIAAIGVATEESLNDRRDSNR